MALQGTLRDFGLADILQLVGIQRKTGILTLEDNDESVSIKFLDGRVVGADTERCSAEEQLGHVLVRTGKITEAQLNEALRIQKRTLQRLGHVLVKSGYITDDELSEGLQVQSLQIIYRLFRWRDGRYNVRLVEDLEYDEAHFTPISAETILMEGARMVDEWPIIERKIRNDRIVFKKTEAAEAMDPGVDSILDQDIDFEFVFDQDGDATEEKSDENDREILLSPEESQLLALVDGNRMVQEINDHSSLGDFDTYRILCELLTRDLIREVEKAAPGASVRRRSGALDTVFGLLFSSVLVGAVAATLLTLGSNPATPWRLSSQQEATDQLRFYASHARLERIERAVQLFYLDTGTYPQALGALASKSYVEPAALADPWGRAYGYQLSPGGYQLFGRGPDGILSPELQMSHRFTAVQQMMLDGPEGAGTAE